MRKRERQANVAGGRTEQRLLRLTQDEDLRLSAMAAQAGMSVQRLLVESTLLVGDRETVTDRHELLTSIMLLRRDIAAVGNNVNQIAHVANATGEVQPHLADEVRALRALCRRVDATLAQLSVPGGAP